MIAYLHLPVKAKVSPRLRGGVALHPASSGCEPASQVKVRPTNPAPSRVTVRTNLQTCRSDTQACPREPLTIPDQLTSGDAMPPVCVDTGDEAKQRSLPRLAVMSCMPLPGSASGPSHRDSKRYCCRSETLGSISPQSGLHIHMDKCSSKPYPTEELVLID